MDHRKHFESIMRMVMPQSFPLGVKIVEKDDAFPDGVVRPSKFIHNHGRLIRSETGIGLSCLSIVKPFWKHEPSLVHPGRGERTFAGTDDSEMCFSIPASYLESLVDGLEKTQKKRIRYPIQGYLLYQPRLVPPMEALGEELIEP